MKRAAPSTVTAIVLGVLVALVNTTAGPALGLGASQAHTATFSLVRYAAPVDHEVIDPFRPPAYIGAPGNRGLEYNNPSGTTVRAGADGEVSFSGQVGGVQVISIDHYDGVRTTYTGMSDIWVSVGEQVGRGSAIGVAAANLHFGAKRLDHYLDPQILIDASSPTTSARLIPAPD